MRRGGFFDSLIDIFKTEGYSIITLNLSVGLTLTLILTLTTNYKFGTLIRVANSMCSQFLLNLKYLHVN